MSDRVNRWPTYGMPVTVLVVGLCVVFNAFAQITIYPAPVQPTRDAPPMVGTYICAQGGLHMQSASAGVIKITDANSAHFKGTLEILRINNDGGLVSERSLISGVFASAGSPLFTIDMPNGTLHSELMSVRGSTSPGEVSLYWTGPPYVRHATAMLPTVVARGSGFGGITVYEQSDQSWVSNFRCHTFVYASQNVYSKIVDQYRKTAGAKAAMVEDEIASVEVIRGYVNSFVGQSDPWMKVATDQTSSNLEAKARALYMQERDVIANGIAGKSNVAVPGQVQVMEIDAIERQLQYVKHMHDKDMRFKQRLVDGGDIFYGSPCLEDGTTLRGDAPAACREIPGLAERYHARSKDVRSLLDKQFSVDQAAEEGFTCIQEAAHNLLGATQLQELHARYGTSICERLMSRDPLP